MLELGAAGMKKTESAPARRQGRPPTMENARERILDVAAELFARDGYEKASLGNLADSVGITKAAIYHYYPNKKEIYEAIIVRKHPSSHAGERRARDVELSYNEGVRVQAAC